MESASSRDGSTDPRLSSLPPAENSSIIRIPHILPHERVFPVQIGGELFKLSGASLSSDAPSYFSQYFLCQIAQAEENGQDINTAIKTLYIDRDPATFRDIALHLQGYHVSPRDGEHFVRLFVDAQFYSLPRLISRLYEESIFISIGHREFQIPRDIFTDPGNSPNYFSLGFAAFFRRQDDVFPGLDREGLIRPPSIIPPSVPNRSAETFAELLRLLRGYPVNIRNEEHRAELLRDARYFHFKGLEQRLVAHTLLFNQARRKEEIALRLENVQKSGVSVSSTEQVEGFLPWLWVNYARPFVDDRPAELVLEIGGETTKIHFDAGGGSPRAEFLKDSKARIARLFQVIASKLNCDPSHFLGYSNQAIGQQSFGGGASPHEEFVYVNFEPASAIVLDGRDFTEDPVAFGITLDDPVASHNPHKRRRVDDSVDKGREWIVRTGQWRLKIEVTRGAEKATMPAIFQCSLVAVKIDAVSSELGRNRAMSFLGS